MGQCGQFIMSQYGHPEWKKWGSWEAPSREIWVSEGKFTPFTHKSMRGIVENVDSLPGKNTFFPALARTACAVRPLLHYARQLKFPCFQQPPLTSLMPVNEIQNRIKSIYYIHLTCSE